MTVHTAVCFILSLVISQIRSPVFESYIVTTAIVSGSKKKKYCRYYQIWAFQEKIFQVCSVLASAALGGGRLLLSVMEQRTAPAPESHLKHVSAPSSLAH